MKEKLIKRDIICSTMCAGAFPTASVTSQALSCDSKHPETHKLCAPSQSSGTMSLSLLTYGGGGGGVEVALAEGAQQRGLAHTGVANQNHLEKAVWGEHGRFLCLLRKTEGDCSNDVKHCV